MVNLFSSFYKIRIPLGELIENTRTFVHPGNGTLYTFRTQWEYDSWNRTRSITYADGEVVHYGYDNGGMLRHMSDTKGNDHYPYVDEIHYDKFGSRTHIAYGNGSYTNYVYEPDMRRLSRLETWDAGQNLMQDLTYTYDAANNITELSNSASDVSGMGGQYSYQFTYDELYRLTEASGSFLDVNLGINLNYYLSMQYSPNGQIVQKELMADQSIAGLYNLKHYKNEYSYPNGQPNTLGRIDDQYYGQNYDFKWDANGNMTYQYMHGTGTARYLCWDEENRLTTVKDGDYMSTYLYDHAGERVWKMTGKVQTMTISGQTVIDYVALDRKTLYTNPYLIVTEAEYTKHYYAESQRIASKLGGGWANALVDPLNDHLPETPNFYYNELNSKLEVGLGKRAECVGMDPNYVFVQDGFTAIDDQYGVSDPEVNQYFYHPDHLGSSSFITNASGNVDQHLQYLPFGEPWIDQRTQNNIRFTFSGKERDEETGYNYFGARYYNSDVSIWLSVDPLSDQAPGWTPYRYGFNNPIQFVDPNGMLEDEWKVNIESNAPPERTGPKGGDEMDYITYVDNEGNVLNDIPEEREVETLVSRDVPSEWNGLAWRGPGFKTEVNQGIDPDYTIENIILGGIITKAIIGGALGYFANQATKGGMTAYETALAGGKHSGWLKTASKWPTSDIQKSISTMESNIVKHQNLISNPTKYFEQYGKGNWNLLHPNQQSHLMNVKWPGDIQRANEQINILQGILKSR